MKNFTVSVAVILFHFSFANVSSISTKNLMADKSFLIQELKESTFAKSSIPIDSTIVSRFFKKYNNLQKYRSDVIAYTKNGTTTLYGMIRKDLLNLPICCMPRLTYLRKKV